MELFNDWKEIEIVPNYTNYNNEDLVQIIESESVSAIQKLKTKLFRKIKYVVGFILLFVGFAIYHKNSQDILIIMGIWILVYGLVGIIIYYQYRQMAQHKTTISTLAYLRQNSKLIKSTLRLEAGWGAIFFPIALSSGVVLSKLIEGWTLSQIFSDTATLRYIIILIVALTPLMALLGIYMNHVSYGNEISVLDKNIKEMEEHY